VTTERACDVSCSGTRVACVHWRIAADTAASTETVDPTRPRHGEQAAVAFHFGIPPDSSGYFKNLDLLGNATERALLRGRGDAV
jgi:hypothetical protein